MTLQHSPPHTLPRIVARLVSGRCIDGIRRTDATFLRHASRDLTPHGRAPRYCWLPGWRRALVRMVTLATACAATWAWFYHRAALIITAISIIAAIIMLAGIRIYRLAVLWSHRRKVIYPLWHMLAELTGYPLQKSGRFESVPNRLAGGPNYAMRERPEKFLTIPRNYATNDKALVKFELPFDWRADQNAQTRVTQVISRHLGGDWAATWSLNTSPRFVALCHEPKPPDHVTLADFIPRFDSVPDSALALGIGANRHVISINLDSDAPHIALSMSTGGGKTDTVALIIASLVRRGCERIDVIDPKRVSHSWARGLPGVHIHRYVAGQMEAIHNVRLCMDGRYDAIDTDPDITFPRHALIIEEQNSLIQDLDDYWIEYRSNLEPAERAKCPRRNPALADLRYILNKGRQCRINVISVYQRMSAMASAGGDARENFGAKILARCSHQTWKILVGTRMPVMARIAGRATLVIGDDIREVQRAHASVTKRDGSADKEGIARLRDFALNGRQVVNEPVSFVKNISISEPELELVSLREACETGILSMRYSAALKARQRDTEFPPGMRAGNGTLGYLPDALRAWQANRVRATVPM
jgi:hypothetical protein